VNGPEIQYLNRSDLQRAVAQRGEPPRPNPAQASPWVAMSVLQKAIRRGQEHLALRAAATLLRDAPEKLLRRLGCIAYEDVGLASLQTVALATAALGGKRARGDLGGEWAITSCLVSELTRAPKCRAADDLLMSCQRHPAFAEAREAMAHLSRPARGPSTKGRWRCGTRSGRSGRRRVSRSVAESPGLHSTSFAKSDGRTPSSKPRGKGSDEPAKCSAPCSRFWRANRHSPLRPKETMSFRRSR